MSLPALWMRPRRKGFEAGPRTVRGVQFRSVRPSPLSTSISIFDSRRECCPPTHRIDLHESTAASPPHRGDYDEPASPVRHAGSPHRVSRTGSGAALVCHVWSAKTGPTSPQRRVHRTESTAPSPSPRVHRPESTSTSPPQQARHIEPGISSRPRPAAHRPSAHTAPHPQ